jgi:hypothetical protein
MILLVGSNAQDLQQHEDELNKRDIKASVGCWHNLWGRYEAVLDVTPFSPTQLAASIDALRRSQAH